jgi:hypothetical protein
MIKFKTYCLSLKHCIDRREWMISQKPKIELDFEFWDAYGPEYVSDELEKKHFSKNYLYEWDFSQKATMATFLSHLSLIEHSVKTKTNLLIIEDDVLLVNKLNWDLVNFSEFDIYNIGSRGSCYSYFISYNGSVKLLEYFNNIIINDAYDYELTKLDSRFIIKNVDTEIFTINNSFVSNIAPNGYIKKQKVLL